MADHSQIVREIGQIPAAGCKIRQGRLILRREPKNPVLSLSRGGGSGESVVEGFE